MPGRPDPSRTLHRMRVSEGFRTFVLDQFEELGEVTARPMFGGLGLYHGGLFFGIVARDVVYLKVDDTTRDDYLKAGMAPFKPYARRPGTMRYYAVPPEVLESPPELTRWAKQAIAVAARAAQTTHGKR